MLFATLFFAGLSAVSFVFSATATSAFHDFSQTMGLALLAMAAAFYVIGLNDSVEIRQPAYYRTLALRMAGAMAPIVLFPLAAFIGVFAVVLSLPVLVMFMPLLMRETINDIFNGSNDFPNANEEEEPISLVLRPVHH